MKHIVCIQQCIALFLPVGFISAEVAELKETGDTVEGGTAYKGVNRQYAVYADTHMDNFNALDELIVSRYVAESITMITGCFGHMDLCTQLTKSYVAKMSCITCYQFCYVSVHN